MSDAIIIGSILFDCSVVLFCAGFLIKVYHAGFEAGQDDILSKEFADPNLVGKAFVVNKEGALL